MRMYNKRNKKFATIPEYKVVTYKENVTIRYGYCDVIDEYAINAMKRLGFEEVKEFVPRVVATVAPPVMRPVMPTAQPVLDPKKTMTFSLDEDAVTASPLATLPWNKLRSMAKERGLKVPRSTKRPELIALIEANRK